MPLLRAVAVLALLSPMAWSAPPPAKFTPDWSYDVLRLKNGAVLNGLILEEMSNGVRFRIVRRQIGRPTVWFTLYVSTPEIAKLEKLPDDKRTELKAKLDEIDPSPQAEARRLEKLDLRPTDWPAKGSPGLRYESDYFVLLSNAPEEVVRRAAYRLENVYAAFTRFLPPRTSGGSPTVIHLHGTLAGYHKSVPGGAAIRNPAFYEPSSNRIVCGTELQKLGDDLAQFRSTARQSLDDLARQEAELVRLYGKKPELARHLAPIKDRRSTIEGVAKSNENVFEQATRVAFQTLYHEAFHAYVGSFVFPKNSATGELPRWLNEGLAQVFETAIFEAGELRIGHADRPRLEKAQEALTRGELPAIADLLASSSRTFVVTHDGQRPAADRAYVAAWALSAYLLFERRALASTEFDECIKSTNAGHPPAKCFERFAGCPMAELEKSFHTWLKQLTPGGPMFGNGK